AAARGAAPARAAAPGKARRGRGRPGRAGGMRGLEKAGSAQTRKTYARHGDDLTMFGVSFATLEALTKRIGLDHELALALWDTGHFDARNLAVKIVDPARLSPDEFDGFVRDGSPRMCGGYAATLSGETAHGPEKLAQWLAAGDPNLRVAGWTLLGHLALRDTTL